MASASGSCTFKSVAPLRKVVETVTDAISIQKNPEARIWVQSHRRLTEEQKRLFLTLIAAFPGFESPEDSLYFKKTVSSLFRGQRPDYPPSPLPPSTDALPSKLIGHSLAFLPQREALLNALVLTAYPNNNPQKVVDCFQGFFLRNLQSETEHREIPTKYMEVLNLTEEEVVLKAPNLKIAIFRNLEKPGAADTEMRLRKLSAAFKHCPKLTILETDNENVFHFRGNKQLTTLRTTQDFPSSEKLLELAIAFPHIRFLGVRARINSSILDILTKFPYLEALGFFHPATHVKYDPFAIHAPKGGVFPHLKKLVLAFKRPGITFHRSLVFLNALKRMPNLTKLAVDPHFFDLEPDEITALKKRGIVVVHISSKKKPPPHKPSPASSISSSGLESQSKDGPPSATATSSSSANSSTISV